MIEVAALTSGRSVPSSRFRVRQHIEPLRAAGLAVTEYVPRIDKYAAVPGVPARYPARLAPQLYAWQGMKVAARLPGLVGSWRSAVTWLERELLPGRLTLEPMLRRPLVFDVDDAIWLASPRAAEAAARIAARAAVVVAGNGFLADWFSGHCDDVRIVPTAIDTERFRPASERHEGRSEFVVGWTGSAATLRYLEGIEGALARAMSTDLGMRLVVIADRRPALPSLPSGRWAFVRWTAESEAESLREFDVGLMPLEDSPWARGKCSFKMLQYMSTGIPVVVSPVGMNAEILGMGEVGLAAGSETEWVDALASLAAAPDSARRLGATGRRVVEEHFSRNGITARLAEILRGAAAA
jgi:glycosyltransferase involved in cell wall biosynthesis